jgi:MYXO-CTERM domain-containing protein
VRSMRSMRSILIKALAVLTIAGAPALASAQETDADVQRTAEVADREDRGEWGWLGLLGLAGLFGLKRREPVDHLSRRERPSPAR